MSVAIGTLGRAATALSPVGTVEIDGKSFPARCVHKLLPIGTRVVIVGYDGTVLLVRDSSSVPDRKALPGSGSVATPTNDNERMRDEAERTSTIYAAVFCTLLCIFPAVGYFAYGLEGIAIGLVCDLVGFALFFFTGGLSI